MATIIKDSWIEEHTHKDGSKTYTAHLRERCFLIFSCTKNIISINEDFFLFDADSIFGEAHHFDFKESAQYRLDEEIRAINERNQKEKDWKIVKSERIK